MAARIAAGACAGPIMNDELISDGSPSIPTVAVWLSSAATTAGAAGTFWAHHPSTCEGRPLWMLCSRRHTVLRRLVITPEAARLQG
jgi:hypothetical protein